METRNRRDIVTLRSLRGSWERALKARNRSPRTIRSYLDSLDDLAEFLESSGMPTGVTSIRREHIESFLVALTEKGLKPASLAVAYRSIRPFFRWLVDEDEITRSPMERMRQPQVPDSMVPILSEVQLRTLLDTTKGRGYVDRRDRAILMLFIDSGARLSEIAGLKVDDLDLERNNTALVMGKGRLPRAIAFEAQTAMALDRYLRVRNQRPDRAAPDLWLGKYGPMKASGLAQLIRRRGTEAGLTIHPHMFRHTMAHNFLADGGTEGDLMSLAGWRSPEMLRVYGRSGAAQRAREAHRSRSLVDRVTQRR